MALARTASRSLQPKVLEPGVPRSSQRVLELDGLRAFAILPVILNHCYPFEGWLSNIGKTGWIGVDLFFVISGYLITGILVDTVGRPHYYKNFIARRTLRIFPLYYVCLVLFVIATKFAHNTSLQKWGGLLGSSFI
jgi:peptidoglycan/LPS O-acetylase OafA/YrhL